MTLTHPNVTTIRRNTTIDYVPLYTFALFCKGLRFLSYEELNINPPEIRIIVIVTGYRRDRAFYYSERLIIMTREKTPGFMYSVY